MLAPRRKQTFHNRKQEIAVAKRGFQDSALVQWLAGKVANKVQNELCDLCAGSDCPSRRDVIGRSQHLYCIRNDSRSRQDATI